MATIILSYQFLNREIFWRKGTAQYPLYYSGRICYLKHHIHSGHSKQGISQHMVNSLFLHPSQPLQWKGLCLVSISWEEEWYTPAEGQPSYHTQYQDTLSHKSFCQRAYNWFHYPSIPAPFHTLPHILPHTADREMANPLTQFLIKLYEKSAICQNYFPAP